MVCLAWFRSEVCGSEDLADRARPAPVSESNQFASDAAVAPGGLLLR